MPDTSDMSDTCKNIEEHNPNNLIFDNIIDYILNNLVVTELFIRGWKVNISLAFNTQSYFDELKKCLTKLYALFY